MKLQRTSHWDGKHELPDRDSQRGKVYRAERIAFHDIRCSKQLRCLSLETYQMIVDSITESAFWAKLLARSDMKPRHVKVGFRGGWRTNATGSPSYINLPPWARTIATLIHELAHSATDWGAQHHFPFAAAHLELVKHYFGRERYERLKRCYKRQKVRIKPKRKATEAQREAGRRLAAQRWNQ